MTYNTRLVMSPAAIVEDARHQDFTPSWCIRRTLMVCPSLLAIFEPWKVIGGPRNIVLSKAWCADYDTLVQWLAVRNLRELSVNACAGLHHNIATDPHVWMVLPASMLERCDLHDDARWREVSVYRRIYFTPDAPRPHAPTTPQLALPLGMDC